MKIIFLLGIILMIAGIYSFIVPDISYKTDQTAFDLGPLSGSINKETTIHIPHYLSGLIILCGLILFSYGYFKYTKGKS